MCEDGEWGDMHDIGRTTFAQRYRILFYDGNVQRIGGNKRANKVFELFLKTTYAKLRRARTYGLGNTLFPGHYAAKKADFITAY